MIVSALISLVSAVLSAAFDLLPTSSIGILDMTNYAGPLQNAGNAMAQWDTFVPAKAMLEATVTVVDIMLPAVLTYKLLNWTWKHIPQIGGFGPGGG